MSVDYSDLARIHYAESLGSRERTPSLKKLAQEFESVFLAQLLTVMRESVESGGLFEESPGQDIYTSMMDQALARALSEKGGIGLAETLLRDLGISTGTTQSPVAAEAAIGPAPFEARLLARAGEVLETMSPEFKLSSSYGWRRDPFDADWRFHHGVDLAAPEGTEVLSVASGRVVFSGTQAGYGKTVIVAGEDGVRIRYAHMRELQVKEGDSISKGQALGEVGSTGRSTGPHLHLEVEGT